jgi:hypothetical protein
VLAKLATRNILQKGSKSCGWKEGALCLIKHGLPKARETAAEAVANLARMVWKKAKIVQQWGHRLFVENGGKVAHYSQKEMQYMWQ